MLKKSSTSQASSKIKQSLFVDSEGVKTLAIFLGTHVYTKLTLQSNFGRPFVLNEVLPYEVSLSGCTNFQEIVDFIEERQMIASMFLKKNYEYPLPGNPSSVNILDFRSAGMVIKFLHESDAIIVKLMMQF